MKGSPTTDTDIFRSAWYGQSDRLDCELPDDNGVDVPVDALQTCVNELPRSASWYQTNHLAADTNWVRQVLGYSAINLYGVSYGTRLGLTIMKEYPTVVRSSYWMVWYHFKSR